jgi:hypothetical protein
VRCVVERACTEDSRSEVSVAQAPNFVRDLNTPDMRSWEPGSVLSHADRSALELTLDELAEQKQDTTAANEIEEPHGRFSELGVEAASEHRSVA